MEMFRCAVEGGGPTEQSGFCVESQYFCRKPQASEDHQTQSQAVMQNISLNKHTMNKVFADI